MIARQFAIKQANGQIVVGYVAGPYSKGLLPIDGGVGRLHVAIIHAEEGFPTGLVEPLPGHATVFVGQDWSPIEVDLRGAEVVA